MRMILALGCLVGLLACSAARQPAPAAWEPSGSGWRTDPVWHDGQAEMAVYEAELEIYGRPRPHLARMYTNTQHMDRGTTTKSADDSGLAVFKHHVTQLVPTERYDYHFSIATFTSVGELALYKLTRSSQEDCGASFTQLWRAGGAFRTLQSGYFPAEGLREGELEAGFVAFDQLPLLLRDFPFEQEPEAAAPRELSLRVLPSLRANRLTPLEPEERLLRAAGLEELELPIGRVSAQRLELTHLDGSPEATFWFHADGGAPWLHVLVALEGPTGSYRLASHERTRYWERP